MKQDIRDEALYRETAALFERLRQPGSGQISDATDLHVAPDGRHAVFAGTLVEALEGGLTSRICRVDLTSGDVRVLTFGPHTDRLPKYSPDGRHIAFLSDRRQPGDFQLYLLDVVSGAATATTPVDGWAEYFHWSEDGSRILLGVAGRGADTSGAQGAMTSSRVAEEAASWMPVVATGAESYRWRTAWIYDVAAHRVRQVSQPGTNVWEAVWCGSDALAAVTSSEPGEGHWYRARLQLVGLDTASSREIYSPRDQLGVLAASPTGRHIAIVAALCSDRWFVAGDLVLIDGDRGESRSVDTAGVDVTFLEWRSEQELLVGGHRGFESVLGLYDVARQRFTEIWKSAELTSGGRYFAVSGIGRHGDCALIGEGFLRAPEIAVIRGGQYACVKSFDLGYADAAKAIGAIEQIRWQAPDGLDIQGWLLRPRAASPHPLVMNVHGGPVWHWRPAWLGRWGVLSLLLLKRGYAVFLPNPRGSSGRGQEFARYVLGDMGGADTFDCLSGLDHLVARGSVDARRLGVTGGSYGGFMTCWLITQDERFAAAVAVAPHTNHVTAHLTSSIPHFVALFLADRYTRADGKYWQRSPVMHAHRARTPTLNICGALDRSAPPGEATQFHNALLENGVESVLVTYPEEGHGVRRFPAAIDYATRVVQWFEAHLGSR